MKQVEQLDRRYSVHKLGAMEASQGTTRRLLYHNEVRVLPSDLSYPIEVDTSLPAGATREMRNMPDYPSRSVESTIDYIRELVQHGITSVMLRLTGDTRGGHAGAYKLLGEHAAAIRHIRSQFPSGVVDLTVDPFDVGLNTDGTWGIQDDLGRLDFRLTLELIANIAVECSKAGADAILTLGRIDSEVEVTKKALAEAGSAMQIKSFSSNTETPNAYIYLEGTPAHTDTGQKILVGNATDMYLRTLMDIYEGTDTVVIKPIENLHVAAMTRMFLQYHDVVMDFLSSPPVADVLRTNHAARERVDAILSDPDEFHRRCQSVKIGAYTVSGTYYLQKTLQQQKGEKFAFDMLDELLKNTVSACGSHLDSIIDRNALWYAKMAPSLGHA